jgi:hypothetical protein
MAGISLEAASPVSSFQLKSIALSVRLNSVSVKKSLTALNGEPVPNSRW